MQLVHMVVQKIVCHYVTPDEYTKIMDELEAAIEEQQTP